MTTNANDWSSCAKAYSLHSVCQIPAFYSEIAATLLTADAGDLPMKFLDVAAGLGTLTADILAKITKEQMLGSEFCVTDFSEGMITEAREHIGALGQSNTTNISFHVMGAEDINFPDNSFTHIGCMFGIMFFSDRAKGLAQMHRVLAPKGTAVIGTWQLSELISIVEDFGKYLQLPHLEEDMTAVAAQVAICSDIKVFEEELSIAGFKDISITPYEHVFSLSNDMDTYLSIASNAVLSKALGKGEAIHEHAQSWIDFMNTPEARAKYISPDGRIHVRFIANIAIAKK